MSPYFSIIVPVYNSSQYLNRCIDSILSQTCQNFELILVNDGSTDNSGNICDVYAQKDKRIRVFHQSNGGVSSARNKGIKEALGEYIIFVDSDDYILTDKLEKTLPYCQHNPDFIVALYLVPKSELYLLHNISKKDFPLVNRIGVVWTSTFKSSILKNHKIYFNENIWHGEDTLFILNYFYFCNNIIFIDEYGYIYEKGHTDGLNGKFQSYEQEKLTYTLINDYRFKIKVKLGLPRNNNKIHPGEMIRIVKSIYVGNSKYQLKNRLSYLKEIRKESNIHINFKLNCFIDKLIIYCIKQRFMIPLDLFMNIWSKKYKR